MASNDLVTAIPWQVYDLHKSWNDSNQAMFCNRTIAMWNEIQSMDFIVKDRCNLWDHSYTNMVMKNADGFQG